MTMSNGWLLAVALAIATMIPVACPAESGSEIPQTTSAELRLPVEGHLPSLSGGTGWLNSEPLTAPNLRGKIVLVDFWTYTCIYWRRTLPYIRAWADKYKDKGLVVVGVHTPEFPFEGNTENVRRAVQEMGIVYPVAVDSDHAIWRAFDNQYWPALYLVDAQGRIRYHYFGEGDYETAERAIQQLLAEAGNSGFDREPATVETRGPEVAAALADLRSPETYLGYGRGENLASPGGAARDRPRDYAAPAQLGLNHWALAGGWTVEQGAVMSNGTSGRIAYRFHARDLHLVLASPEQGQPVRFRVTLDGAPPGADNGIDIDPQGWGTVSEPRLYQLIRQNGEVSDRTFEIEFLDPGIRAYAFTFG
jgi:thiol-disulfide isomerase/thioredoxin